MMEPFDPRSIINGSMLKQFAGQTVSIMVRVESVAGSTLLASSTDNHKLRINLSTDLDAAQGAWVEVIGVPHGADTIRGKEVIEFGGENIDFDVDGYNGAAHLLNNVKSFYRSG
ncbi:replication protein A 14 kDa subunit A [Drosophila madeirensis]|uniref:Replication protein A 14 kDa subunit A n=1 Tax=Drosophila madeirensis TaxID=30013 RepID=A0AAU9FXY9_DROMD